MLRGVFNAKDKGWGSTEPWILAVDIEHRALNGNTNRRTPGCQRQAHVSFLAHVFESKLRCRKYTHTYSWTDAHYYRGQLMVSSSISG